MWLAALPRRRQPALSMRGGQSMQMWHARYVLVGWLAFAAIGCGVDASCTGATCSAPQDVVGATSFESDLLDLGAGAGAAGAAAPALPTRTAAGWGHKNWSARPG